MPAYNINVCGVLKDSGNQKTHNFTVKTTDQKTAELRVRQQFPEIFTELDKIHLVIRETHLLFR